MVMLLINKMLQNNNLLPLSDSNKATVIIYVIACFKDLFSKETKYSAKKLSQRNVYCFLKEYPSIFKSPFTGMLNNISTLMIPDETEFKKFDSEVMNMMESKTESFLSMIQDNAKTDSSMLITKKTLIACSKEYKKN